MEFRLNEKTERRIFVIIGQSSQNFIKCGHFLDKRKFAGR